jgi:hypothetical protein
MTTEKIIIVAVVLLQAGMIGYFYLKLKHLLDIGVTTLAALHALIRLHERLVRQVRQPSFPDNPSVGDTHDYDGKKYMFDGTMWIIMKRL